ncbi:U5 snrnp-specific protein, putative [Hepatocystis sp. ex Piliocolobus tephrosceles]|nr:U5 snrnp-specific protein, putative [Hepatocystis sp. ex Piliocolobus tephrosceles]
MAIVKSNNFSLEAEEHTLEERKTGLFYPNMLINTHKGEVYSIDFSSDGKYICSSSFDMTVMIHNVYNECETINVLNGHKNAVLQAKWFIDNDYICSVSADHTACLWDVENGQRIRTFKGHNGIINGLDIVNHNLFVTCSDDGNINMWDFRNKKCVKTINNSFPLLSIVCSGNKINSMNNRHIYSSCTDNTIKVYDLETSTLTDTLKGHTNYITGLSINKEETMLASISADETICFWDIQPFPCDEKLLFNLNGPPYSIDYNLIKLNFNNDSLLACGSENSYLYVYDYKQKILKYTLPGHNSSVNDVAFHPTEDIIASCSSDKTIFLGEF